MGENNRRKRERRDWSSEISPDIAERIYLLLEKLAEPVRGYAEVLGIDIADEDSAYEKLSLDDLKEGAEVVELARKAALEGSSDKRNALRKMLATPTQRLLPEEKAVCIDYERNGYRYQNQEAFASKHGISVATFKRILPIYEIEIGRNIRPGRGRSRKGKR